MILQAPSSIDNPLYEGSLAAETTEQRSLRGPIDVIARELDELPAVSVGKPVTLPVSELLGYSIPAALRSKLDEADFYVVQFAFSMRPRRRDRGVDWARFAVELLPDDTGRQPLVFDVHPRLETQEVKHDVKVSLSPSVKFSEVAISAGSVEHQLEYKQLLPMITASGIGEKISSWDFEAVRGAYISGVRVVHMIVSAPPGTVSGMVSIRVAANVVGPGIQIPVILRRGRTESDILTTSLWTGAKN